MMLFPKPDPDSMVVLTPEGRDSGVDAAGNRWTHQHSARRALNFAGYDPQCCQRCNSPTYGDCWTTPNAMRSRFTMVCRACVKFTNEV